MVLEITTAVVLDCVDPVYTLTYGSTGLENSWGPIFIYTVSAFTFVYVVISIILVFACKVNCSEERQAAGTVTVCSSLPSCPSVCLCKERSGYRSWCCARGSRCAGSSSPATAAPSPGAPARTPPPSTAGSR